MLLSFSRLALGIAAISGVLASNVIEANSKNFDSLIGSSPALVEFYAPWCGHCKTLAPVYEQLADSFASKKEKVKIVKVDADGDGKAVGAKYGVRGFPTLKWFPKGVTTDPEDYEGGRDLASLSTFVTTKSGQKSNVKAPPPPATLRLEQDTFGKIALDKSKNALVAFTASWCGHCKNLKPTLEVVAKNFASESDCIVADFDADAAPNKPIAAEYDVKSFPTIKFFPKGDDQTPISYEVGRSEADFTEFLNKHCGTHRAVGGGLNGMAGRVASLDSLAAQFFSQSTRSQVYQDAVALSDSIGTGAKYYLRVMEKVVNGTEDYIERETKRLTSILQKKTLAPSKLDEIKIKANILAAFAQQKVEEVKEHIKSEL